MLEMLTTIFQKVLYMSIVGSILGILILGLIKFLDNKLSAKWKFCMLLIPVMFLIIPISRIQIETENDFAFISVIDKVERTLTDYDKMSNIVNLNTSKSEANILGKNEIEKTNIVSNNFKLYSIIPIIWLIGLGISGITFIIGNINLTYRINKSKKLEDTAIKLILMRCKRKLGITKKIQIRIQNLNVSPCIYGLIKPKILVSKEFMQQDEQIIENVFMHELSHYKRKDMITNYILLIMTTIHWFNPFIYKFFKKVRQEMELATDEIALRRMDKEEKKKYGLTLISLLQTYETGKVATKMLCVTDDNKNMERRIKKIKASTTFKKYKASIIIFIMAIIICAIMPFVVKPIQAIDLEEDKIYIEIKNYLIELEEQKHKKKMQENNINSEFDDFKAFVSMAKLGIEEDKKEVIVYVWVLIKTYYVQDGKLYSDKTSMPYKFNIKNNEIINYQIPNSIDDNSSLKEIFPNSIIDKMEKSKNDIIEEKIDYKAQIYYKYLYNKEKSDANEINSYIDEKELN